MNSSRFGATKTDDNYTFYFALSTPEGASLATKRGRPSKAELQARRGKSMGRYPLKAAVEKYLERRKLQVGKSTFIEVSRKLRYIASELEKIKAQGAIKTTGPKFMGPPEIDAFIEWMRDPAKHKGKPLDPDTQVRYLTWLEAVLVMNGNLVIEKMREEGYRKFPQKVGRKPIRSIAEPDLATIQKAASKVRNVRRDPEGWRKAKARFLMAAYVATGLRPSELRLVHIEDLNTKTWRLKVQAPKGADKWAYNRTVTITPPYRSEFLAFLEERDKMLQHYGRTTATYLIPNLQGGKNTFYSSNHFRVLKKEVQELSGIDFRLKDFRPTFATLTVEKDPNLLIDVSTQLGHSNIKTTQRYYAQISAESAGQRIERAWEGKAPTKTPDPVSDLLAALGVGSVEELKARLTSQAPCTETSRIDFKNRLPGYY
jgi:integrase